MSIQYPEALTRVLNKKKVTISQPMMIPRPDNPNATIEANAWCEYYKDLLPIDEKCMEPTSQWFYPLVDKYEEIDVKTDVAYPDGYTVEAIILTTFYWRTLLRENLPRGTHGLVVVIKNACFDSDFTYQIDGPIATYIGVGDFHDPKFAKMRISSSMINLGNYKNEVTSTYSGFPMDVDSCWFEFDVYPSDRMKQGKTKYLCLSLLYFLFLLKYFLKQNFKAVTVLSMHCRRVCLLASLLFCFLFMTEQCRVVSKKSC
jgi:hypothetical protein